MGHYLSTTEEDPDREHSWVTLAGSHYLKSRREICSLKPGIHSVFGRIMNVSVFPLFSIQKCSMLSDLPSSLASTPVRRQSCGIWGRWLHLALCRGCCRKMPYSHSRNTAPSSSSKLFLTCERVLTQRSFFQLQQILQSNK